MSKLNLFKGLKARVFTNDARTKIGAKDGVVSEITDKLIVIKFENYKESFNIGNILSENNIDVRINREWTSLKILLRG